MGKDFEDLGKDFQNLGEDIKILGKIFTPDIEKTVNLQMNLNQVYSKSVCLKPVHSHNIAEKTHNISKPSLIRASPLT